jgi:hypothetical protein
MDIKLTKNKSVAFLHINDKQAEKEIRETTPFTIVTNYITYLGVILTKQVKNLYENNFKSLKKEIEGNLRKWRDQPCSRICRINILKKWPSCQRHSLDSMQSPSKSQHNSSKTLKDQLSNSSGKAKNKE